MMVPVRVAIFSRLLLCKGGRRFIATTTEPLQDGKITLSNFMGYKSKKLQAAGTTGSQIPAVYLLGLLLPGRFQAQPCTIHYHPSCLEQIGRQCFDFFFFVVCSSFLCCELAWLNFQQKHLFLTSSDAGQSAPLYCGCYLFLVNFSTFFQAKDNTFELSLCHGGEDVFLGEKFHPVGPNDVLWCFQRGGAV